MTSVRELVVLVLHLALLGVLVLVANRVFDRVVGVLDPTLAAKV